MPGMSNLPWIKLYTEIIDDPKLRRLDEPLKWRFVQLLALAGECDAEGYLSSPSSPLDADDIAWRLRVDLDQLQSDLQVLAQRGLIRFDAERRLWLIPSFAQRQERPRDEARRYWREQKRRQRSLQAESKTKGAPGLAAEAVELSDSDHPTRPSQNQELSPNTQPEDMVEDSLEDSLLLQVDNVPLKRRGEKNRGEKRRREARERSAPPSRPGGSPLDQLEQELAQKNAVVPPGGAHRRTKKKPSVVLEEPGRRPRRLKNP